MENIRTESYDMFANDYRSWEMHAQDLEYASDILSEKHKEVPVLLDEIFKSNANADADNIFKTAGLIFISLMLKGYATENFAKAIYIKKGITVAKDGKLSFQIKGSTNHDLKSMLEDIIILDDAEKKMLEKLSVFVKNYGRYPCSKKAIPSISWEKEDNSMLSSLINKLKDILQKL